MAERFMPDWVLGLTCGYISFRFVTGNIPLQSFTNKYASLLSAKYADASSKKLLNISQEMLYFMATFNFMSTIRSETHVAIVKSYMFNNLNTTSYTYKVKKRKIKTLFGSALNGQKQVTTHEVSMRGFKNFVFQLRANNRYKAPTDWNLTDEQEIDWLIDIYKTKVRVIDGLDQKI